MKVHFAASTSKINELGDQYSLICELTKKMGHTITRDWLPEAIKLINSGKADIPREGVYDEVLKAILVADVIIAEGKAEADDGRFRRTTERGDGDESLRCIFRESKDFFLEWSRGTGHVVAEVDMEKVEMAFARERTAHFLVFDERQAQIRSERVERHKYWKKEIHHSMRKMSP
jgi:hypothetical protein